MKREEIVNLTKNILNDELNICMNDIFEEKTLLELGIDSISLMTLIVYIEDRLSIEIEVSDVLVDDYSKITLDMLVNAIEQVL